jgi:hypothetical protein
MGRPAYQCGQLSVKQPLIALQVRILPDLPKQWRVTRLGDRRCLLNRWINNCGSSPLLSAFENVV